MSKRPEAADAVALSHREELRSAYADGFQDDLDPLAIDSIDGERPAKQRTR